MVGGVCVCVLGGEGLGKCIELYSSAQMTGINFALKKKIQILFDMTGLCPDKLIISLKYL